MTIWEDATSTMKTILSQCVSFQSMVGAVDANAALAQIHVTSLPDPEDADEGRQPYELDDIYPCALIVTEGLETLSIATGVTNQYSPAGELHVYFYTFDDPAKSQAQNAVVNEGQWAAIYDELLTKTGPGGLNIVLMRVGEKGISTIGERGSSNGTDGNIPGRVRDLATCMFAVTWSHGNR